MEIYEPYLVIKATLDALKERSFFEDWFDSLPLDEAMEIYKRINFHLTKND